MSRQFSMKPARSQIVALMFSWFTSSSSGMVPVPSRMSRTVRSTARSSAEWCSEMIASSTPDSIMKIIAGKVIANSIVAWPSCETKRRRSEARKRPIQFTSFSSLIWRAMFENTCSMSLVPATKKWAGLDAQFFICVLALEGASKAMV